MKPTKHRTLSRVWSRVGSGLLLHLGLILTGAAAAAEPAVQPPEACKPACATGQICYQGVCFAPTAPRPETPPAPAGEPAQASPPAPSPAPPPPSHPAYRQPGQYPGPGGPAPYPGPSPAGAPAEAWPPPPETTAVADPKPRFRRLVIMPSAGVHSFLGDAGRELDPGPSLGVLGGYRLHEYLALGLQINLDIPLPRSRAEDRVEAFFALAPLAHLDTGPLRLVAGPKLGFFVGSVEPTSGDRTGRTVGDVTDEDRVDTSGFAAGVNLGAFMRLGRVVSLGALTSLDYRKATRRCMTIGGDDVCGRTGLPGGTLLMSLSVAMLF